MLITRDQKSILERYFVHFPKRSDLGGKKLWDTAYDVRMFEVIEKVIRFYEMDTEKSAFISKYIIGQRSWKKAFHDLHIERRTYYAWKDEILSDAVICAVVNGLIVLDIDLALENSDESAAP